METNSVEEAQTQMAQLRNTSVKGELEVDGTLGSKLTALIADKMYPVGSIYMSVSSSNPGSILGGTWTGWGSGRVPVSVDTGDSDFNSPEKTGGNKTQSLCALIGAINDNQMTLSYEATGAVPGHSYTSGYGASGTTSSAPLTPFRHVNHSTTVLQSNSASPTTLQPYITCYMWKRTA